MTTETSDHPSEAISLYVIIGHARATNARAKAMLRLKNRLRKVTIVYPGTEKLGEDYWPIKPWPNPTGILSKIGLGNLKTHIDKRVLFPSHAVLFDLAMRRKLRARIEADQKAKMQVVVLTLMPPHGVAGIVPYLREHFPDVRLLVDWQDLWLHDATYANRVPAHQRIRAERLERAVVDAANINITTNRFAADKFKSLFGVTRDHVVSIPHHFDEDDAVEVDRAESSIAKVGFMGTLFKPPKVPGGRVLRAFDACANAGRDVEFHLFGGAQWRAAETLASMQNDIVHLHPHAPHKEAMANLARCDLLLITLADEENCRIIMHGKLPHYFLLGIPIIAMVPEDCFVAQAVRETNSGVVIDTSEDWGDSLARVLESYEDDPQLGCTFDQDAIEQYDWQNIQNRWLNAILN